MYTITIPEIVPLPTYNRIAASIVAIAGKTQSLRHANLHLTRGEAVAATGPDPALADELVRLVQHELLNIGPGRPAKLAKGRAGRVYLDEQTWAWAEEYGNGNMSEGIRLALQKVMSQ